MKLAEKSTSTRPHGSRSLGRLVLLAVALLLALPLAAAQSNTLRIGYAATPLNTLDPHRASSMTDGNFMALALETLVQFDADGGPVPQARLRPFSQVFRRPARGLAGPIAPVA